MLLPGSGIRDSNPPITAPAHDNTKAAFDGAEKAAPACVIRMFAKNLDASWYIETRLARWVCFSPMSQEKECSLEQLCLSLSFSRAQPGSDQTFCQL